MANEENFHYQWNDFESNIKTSWQDLQVEKELCDVTLACDDNQIEAHKIIISSCSSVLKDIVKRSQNLHPYIYLRKVKYRDLKNLVNFMYQGEVDIAREDLPAFLDVAEDLKVKGLSGIKDSSLKQDPPQDENHKNSLPFRKKRKRNEEKVNKFVSVCPTSEFVYKIAAHENDSNSSFLSTETLYSCDQCEKSFKQESALRLHVDSSHQGTCLPCKHCDYLATTAEYLERHLELNHDSLDISGNDETRLDDGDNDITIDCNIDDTEVGIKEESEEIVYSCDTSSFVPTFGLKPFACEMCEKQYSSKRGLEDHGKTVHEEAFKHFCNQCDYKAIKSSYLRVHIESVHEGIRYSCNQCDYKANKKSNLKRHIEKQRCKLTN